MEHRDFADWVERYEAAWRTPGTLVLAGLFVPDASYRTAPYEKPFEGLAEIELMWERGREAPDEDFVMETEIVVAEDHTSVIRVSVDYGEPLAQSYRELWIVVLREDGRCTSFEEWPFWPPGTKGEWPINEASSAG